MAEAEPDLPQSENPAVDFVVPDDLVGGLAFRLLSGCQEPGETAYNKWRNVVKEAMQSILPKFIPALLPKATQTEEQRSEFRQRRIKEYEEALVKASLDLNVLREAEYRYRLSRLEKGMDPILNIPKEYTDPKEYE